MGWAMQCFAAIASSFGSFMMGMLTAWPSYSLELYRDENTTLLSAPLTELEGSLLGSLPSLGAMLGTVLAGPIVDTFGRQKGGVILSLPYVVAWAVILATRGAVALLTARFVMGITGGSFLVLAPLLISEVAENHIRGFLASGPTTFYCTGMLVSYAMGWALVPQTILWANLLTGVLGTLLCSLVPETPLFLLRQGREEEAKQSLAKYRGATTSSKLVQQELVRIKSQLTPAVELLPMKDDVIDQVINDADKEKLRAEEALGIESPEQPKMSSLKLLFLSPSSRRAFVVIATVLTLQVLMGLPPVLVHARALFSAAAPGAPAHACSVLLAASLASAAALTAALADRTGRRILLVSSSLCASACLCALGTMLSPLSPASASATSSAPAWLPAALLLAFCFCFNAGAGSVPYILLAECFVPEVQGVASMLLVEWVWFLNFAMIAVFPVAARLLGVHGLFYCFAAFGLSNAAVGCLYLPETKGLSNRQIQEAFLRRKK